jgi:hypothetical protein
MLKRTVFSAFCAAALLCTSAAYAQESATLTLRSGEKVSGQLIDLGGVGYTVRVNGNERQIPQNDVSVIDFTGGTMSDADWAKFTGTTQVVLRNGQTIDGSLYDIGGTSPLRLTIRTSNGDRDLASSEVARIVISRPANVVAPAGNAVPPAGNAVPPAGNAVPPAGNPLTPAGNARRGNGGSRTGNAGLPIGTSRNRAGVGATSPVAGAITVQANQAWTSTGITVRRGQTITFQTSGQVQLSDDANDIATADGARRYAANAPLRQVPAGALIGRIGNGTPFAIGSQTSIVAPASGLLFLGINDDGFGDNRGNYQVVVR